MSYLLGERSKQRLESLEPDLVRVVQLAITLTPVDFTVLEGMRTLSRQRSLLASGASKTLNSRHLTGHAVDLGAYVNGAVKWDWDFYFYIAEAMRLAAIECGVLLEWGGAWGYLLNRHESARIAHDTYVSARHAAKKRTFVDGPHFQLPW